MNEPTNHPIKSNSMTCNRLHLCKYIVCGLNNLSATTQGTSSR